MGSDKPPYMKGYGGGKIKGVKQQLRKKTQRVQEVLRHKEVRFIGCNQRPFGQPTQFAQLTETIGHSILIKLFIYCKHKVLHVNYLKWCYECER